MKLHERIPLIINMQRLRFKNFHKLNQPQKYDSNVIVSLTSIPSRLGVVHLTIMSLMLQSWPPKKIVLWLHKSAAQTIPRSLENLCGQRFEIRYTDLDSSHCKLVPSLLAFPSDIIVTCDDDHYYSRNWLKTLIKTSVKNPHKIVAQKFREMKFDLQGKPLAYRKWSYNRKLKNNSDRFLALGVGGVLYPVNSLYLDATRHDIYIDKCPKADDLWFKAMALLNNVDYIETSSFKPFYELMDSQEVTLKSSNIDHDRNVDQWLALCDYYPELNKINPALL